MFGGIRIIPPQDILKEQEESIVCIAARAYAAMADQLRQIGYRGAVVLSPYAKSVTALPASVWEQIIKDYASRGYRCYTNITGDETALEGTEAVSHSILEIRSVIH